MSKVPEFEDLSDVFIESCESIARTSKTDENKVFVEMKADRLLYSIKYMPIEGFQRKINLLGKHTIINFLLTCIREYGISKNPNSNYFLFEELMERNDLVPEIFQLNTNNIKNFFKLPINAIRELLDRNLLSNNILRDISYEPLSKTEFFPEKIYLMHNYIKNNDINIDKNEDNPISCIIDSDIEYDTH